VAADGGGVVAADGGGVVAADGGGVVAADGGGVVAADGHLEGETRKLTSDKLSTASWISMWTSRGFEKRLSFTCKCLQTLFIQYSWLGIRRRSGFGPFLSYQYPKSRS
jgi:hypothetical protein